MKKVMLFESFVKGLEANKVNEGNGDGGLSPEVLNNKLQQWNKKYSQSFKFKNGMPRTSTNDLEGLLNSIDDSNKENVKIAISKLAELLSNEEFNNQDVEISGYTSTTGNESTNKTISENRAESTLNAIKSLLKDKKIETKINFSFIGHGEDPNYLIILNDNNPTEEPKVNTKIAKLSPEIIEKIKDNVKARQSLNRRVLIKIKQFPTTEILKTPPIKKTTTTTTTTIEDEPKKTLPNVTINLKPLKIYRNVKIGKNKTPHWRAEWGKKTPDSLKLAGPQGKPLTIGKFEDVENGKFFFNSYDGKRYVYDPKTNETREMTKEEIIKTRIKALAVPKNKKELKEMFDKYEINPKMK
jgi:hypothetical protein